MTKQKETSQVPPDSLMIAYLCIKDAKSLNESVAILDRFGLNDNQIARVCDAAVGSVRNARLQNKKAEKKKQKASKAEGGA